MSTETSAWLNNNVLVGYTEKRGTAWHWRRSDQGAESNHYPMAIPTDDVVRRLFHWEAATSPLVLATTGQQVNDRQAIYRADTGDVFGIFTADGYQIHQYREWLLENMATVLDTSMGELAIASAGLLKGGGVAWVQLELPENVKIGDDEYRPFICATTSHTGEYATSYKTGTTAVVCDNTLAAFHQGAKGMVLRHTKNSLGRTAEIRQVLDIAFKASEAEVKAIQDLMNTKITAKQQDKILDILIGKSDDPKAFAKRSQIESVYGNHAAVKNYKGTAWGLVQTFNTYNQHLSRCNTGTMRSEKVMVSFLSGKTEKADLDVVKAIKSVVTV